MSRSNVIPLPTRGSRKKSLKKPRIELVYGELGLEGELTFIEKTKAEYYAELIKAISEGEDRGITWGEFRKSYPSIFEEILDSVPFETDFCEWYEKEKMSKPNLTRSEAKETYRREYQHTCVGLPLMEWPFKIGGDLFDCMQALFRFSPQRGDCVPPHISEKYGYVEESLMDGEFQVFKSEDEEELMAALEGCGYACTRNDALVYEACYGAF